MTLMLAIQTQRQNRKTYVQRKIRDMNHRLGYETVCQVWELQFDNTPLGKIAEQLDVPYAEIKKLINCTSYPHPHSFK
jgi:hypothetical protein